MKKHPHILIVQTAFIGDVILITPLIKAVSEYFSRPHIDAMVIPQTCTVLQNNPLIRQILLFDKRAGKLGAFIHTLHRLRAERYDIVFTPHSSLTTGLLLFLAGIPRRVGYDRWLARHLLTDKIPDVSGKHKIAKNLSLLKAFTTRNFDLQTAIYPSPADLQKARQYVSVAADSKVIAIAPGSVWFTKRWLQEHYITLAKLLHTAGFTLVFIGSQEEKPMCSEIISSAQIKAINAAGELSLLQSAALISLADVLICNDSGALHLGNAVQTTVFAIFGPTVQAIGYYPYRSFDRVLEVDLACRPCGSHGHQTCPLSHHDCMRLVTPEIVYDAVIRYFG
jgi:heptosyltransferase-2